MKRLLLTLESPLASGCPGHLLTYGADDQYNRLRSFGREFVHHLNDRHRTWVQIREANRTFER
jgi:hypothetical protein